MPRMDGWMERHKQQVFFPHISGGWKFKVKVTNDSHPGGSLFLGCRQCPDACVPTLWSERRASLSCSDKDAAPIMHPQPHDLF